MTDREPLRKRMILHYRVWRILRRKSPLSANGLLIGKHPRKPGEDTVALHD